MTVTSFGRPGVYVQERPLPRNIPPQGSGYARVVVLGASTIGSMEPTYVRSWREFVAEYGGIEVVTALQQAVYMAFSNASGPLYVVRMTDHQALSAKPATHEEPYMRYAFSAISPGVWGNGIVIAVSTDFDGNGVRLDTVTVRVTSPHSTYPEVFPGLSHDPSSNQYLPAVINDISNGSRYIVVEEKPPGSVLASLELNATSMSSGLVDLTVSVANDRNTVTTLEGGHDGGMPSPASYPHAYSRLDGIEGALVLYASDASRDMSNSDGASVNGSLTNYAATRGDSFAVTDTPVGLSPTEALSYGTNQSTYGALYYPHVRVSNPSTSAAAGSSVLVPAGAAISGLIISNDRLDGPWRTPAGPSLSLSTTSTSRFLGVERLLTNDELDDLNTASRPVNAIRPITNAGVTVMGARTRSVDTILRYVNVRRTLNYIKAETKDKLAFALFQPITADLMTQVEITLGSFLTEVWSSGGLVGAVPEDAYYVICNTTNNNGNSISQGFLYVDVGVALSVPAEYVVVRIGQFEGGTSATEF